MEPNVTKKFEALSKLVGNTNLIKVDFTYKGKPLAIYAKAEYTNYTGSIKDRIAYHILKKAYQDGVMNKETEIVEATSGNTGIAFSSLGRYLGHKVVIYMPNWMSCERINLMSSLGAEVRLVSPEQGGFLGSIDLTKTYAKERGNVFLPCQFENEENVEAHYTTTGPEIWTQMELAGEKIDAFVAGVGTGGTVMGVGRYLREHKSDIKIHPLEPSNSPVLQTGYKVGAHRIQGISDEFIPPIVKLDQMDSVVSVDDGDSIIMAQKLARQLGFTLGISSGANFIGALKLLLENPEYTGVVTIFSDNSLRYLTTDYTKEEPVKDDFYSTDVEITGIEVIQMPR